MTVERKKNPTNLVYHKTESLYLLAEILRDRIGGIGFGRTFEFGRIRYQIAIATPEATRAFSAILTTPEYRAILIATSVPIDSVFDTPILKNPDSAGVKMDDEEMDDLLNKCDFSEEVKNSLRAYFCRNMAAYSLEEAERESDKAKTKEFLKWTMVWKDRERKILLETGVKPLTTKEIKELLGQLADKVLNPIESS